MFSKKRSDKLNREQTEIYIIENPVKSVFDSHGMENISSKTLLCQMTNDIFKPFRVLYLSLSISVTHLNLYQEQRTQTEKP